MGLVYLGAYSSLVEENSLENYEAVKSRAWVQILPRPPLYRYSLMDKTRGFYPLLPGSTPGIGAIII